MRKVESIGEDFEVIPQKTALVIIDMNYVDCHPDYGLGRKLKELKGVDAEYYFDRVENLVIPNLQKLTDACRKNGVKVIYSVVGYKNPDMSDLVKPLRNPRLGLEKSTPGNKEFEVREEVKPQPGDAVMTKPCSGFFAGTNIDQKLKNMGIDTLIVTGVVTDGCVYNTAVPAADRGYNVMVIDDATATVSQESHDAYLGGIAASVFFQVRTTDQVIEEIKKGQ